MGEDSGERDALRAVADRVTGDQVFGEPVRQGGTTLLPVAEVRFGGGRGGGGDSGGGTGSGSGAGGVARPVGAFAVREDGSVVWHPAVSVNRIVLGGQIALASVLVTAALAFGCRRRKRC
ncbi:hypothetical protein IQ251_11355 [Saccharopolyspora sp. HNM0983]|uniref:Sporulation protein n=1 Tax=Saccharopolyspora montiporae TaxID=2781240 RepID=A0A929G1U7_9PSEU|nr:hypothetical protein [Saccharopolyspora sp. HNM0983]MBE9375038.1 hypothetical protein [Saccharopolyspora sp. HNM0983]